MTISEINFIFKGMINDVLKYIYNHNIEYGVFLIFGGGCCCGCCCFDIITILLMVTSPCSLSLMKFPV